MKLLCLLLLLWRSSLPGARNFDGVDDNADCGTLADAFLTENGAVTISAWIFPDTLGESSLGKIIGKGSVSWGLQATNRVLFRVVGSTILVRATANSSLTLGVWSHVLVTWDGSVTATNVHIYINGTEPSYASSISGVSPTDNSGDELAIGASDNAGSNDFDGSIAELGVWNVALSANEITSLNTGAPVAATRNTSLMGYWPLWGASTTEADYGSTTKHNCTVTGAVLANHSPTGPFIGSR